MKLNTTPENRKDMAHAISELLGEPSVYCGMPSCAYAIGNITVNRDGTIDSEDLEAIARVKPMLVERGWLAEEANAYLEVASETEEPEPTESNAESEAEQGTEPEQPADDEITQTNINMPIGNYSIATLSNIIRVFYSRQALINRMLRMDKLHIDDEVISLLNDSRFESAADLEAMLTAEEDIGMLNGLAIHENHIVFSMPYEPEEPCKWVNYGKLIEAILKLVSGATRVKTEKLELTAENEKYYANAWLNRMGFGGPEHKELRHELMDHLSGFAAFKDSGRMQAHKEKYSAIRASHRDSEAEVNSNEQPEA